MEAVLVPTVGADPVRAADAAALAAGMRAIGAGWMPLGERDVFGLIAHHVGHDLAYGTGDPARADEDRRLALRLLSLADAGALWYTNHSATLDQITRGSYSFTEVSGWTFGLAYVAVGPTNTLFVCFQAED